MRLYHITASCLVDDCLCHWYVKARNEREAWGKGYFLALRSSVADSGTVDCERAKVIPAGVKLAGGKGEPL